jgi:uncharacterized OsmC-like protein
MADPKTTHMLNGFNLDVLQETIHAIEQDPEMGKCVFRGKNRWLDADHNRTIVDSFYGAKQELEHKHPFEMHSGEPTILAGGDNAPNPVEYLLHSLAGCITTGIAAHAACRGIHIEEMESEVEGDLDLRGFLGLDDNAPKGFTDIRINVKVKADPRDFAQIRELPDYSPVAATLANGARVDVRVERK